MKLMRRILAFLTAALLAFGLCACGNGTLKDPAYTAAAGQTEAPADPGAAPGDFPGEPPAGGPGGMPPDGKGRAPGGSSSADVDYSGADNTVSYNSYLYHDILLAFLAKIMYYYE